MFTPTSFSAKVLSQFGLTDTAIHRDYVCLMCPNEDETSSQNVTCIFLLEVVGYNFLLVVLINKELKKVQCFVNLNFRALSVQTRQNFDFYFCESRFD